MKSWLVSVFIPVALVLTGVRLLLTPAFVQLEYRTPGFPPDAYGFSRADRLHWSLIALDYLLNDAGISFLGDLRFADGSPVYNERELFHMEDVKIVVQAALWVWYGALAIPLAMGIWAWSGGWKVEFTHGLERGGWLTIALVGAIILFVLFGFGVFFVAFHGVFFDPGTWVFRYSDTLIRLFPERFWRDAFLLVGAFAVGSALLLVAGSNRSSKN